MISRNDPLAIELTVCCVCQDSPINKLLYARDIPRYKQMVERYFHQNQVCVTTGGCWETCQIDGPQELDWNSNK